MARPKSEDKRKAILAAAAAVIAEQGVSAPTAGMAKRAGVAEGSLFTYFATKDALLNALYLDLKTELHAAMLSSYPAAGNLKQRARHVWGAYTAWGVSNPGKRRAMAQLGVSDRITESSRAAGAAAFGDIATVFNDSIAQGALRDQPAAFTLAILEALAVTTMDFIIRDPAQAETYDTSGFEAFWKAVSTG